MPDSPLLLQERGSTTATTLPPECHQVPRARRGCCAAGKAPGISAGTPVLWAGSTSGTAGTVLRVTRHPPQSALQLCLLVTQSLNQTIPLLLEVHPLARLVRLISQRLMQPRSLLESSQGRERAQVRARPVLLPTSKSAPGAAAPSPASKGCEELNSRTKEESPINQESLSVPFHHSSQEAGSCSVL